MFDIKGTAFLIIACIITGSLVWWFSPEKISYRVPGEVEQKLDSLTTLNRSLRVTSSQLKDSVKHTTTAFSEYVATHEDQLIAYNRLIGTLNLQIDSLEQANTASLFDLQSSPDSAGQFRDTTLQASARFGAGLIEAISRGGIRSDSLFIEQPEIRQLRPVEIDLAQFVHSDGRTVEALVTSRDFEELKTRSLTTLEEKKKFPWKWIFLGAGFLLGTQL